jgi:hypothetical protein
VTWELDLPWRVLLHAFRDKHNVFLHSSLHLMSTSSYKGIVCVVYDILLSTHARRSICLSAGALVHASGGSNVRKEKSHLNSWTPLPSNSLMLGSVRENYAYSTLRLSDGPGTALGTERGIPNYWSLFNVIDIDGRDSPPAKQDLWHERS